MDTNKDSTHKSQSEDNLSTFPRGLEFLNDTEKEKSNGKLEQTRKSAPSRFVSPSEGEMQQILSVFRVGFDAQRLPAML